MKFRFPEDISSLGNYNVVQIGDTKFLEYLSKKNVDKRHATSSNLVLSFVINGTKVVHTVNEEVEAKEGEFLLIDKGNSLMSERIPVNNEPYQNLLFFLSDTFVRDFIDNHPQLFEEELDSQPRFIDYSVAKMKIDLTIRNFLISSLIIISNKSLQSERVIKLKLEELLIYVIKSPSNNRFRNLLHQTFQRAAKSFSANLNNSFKVEYNVEDYAHLCSMSVSTFKRKFKEAFKTTPGEWITSRKLTIAEELLCNNYKWTIEHIAHEVGYENPSHFIKMFKKHYGVTPNEYRNKTNIAIE